MAFSKLQKPIPSTACPKLEADIKRWRIDGQIESARRFTRKIAWKSMQAHNLSVKIGDFLDNVKANIEYGDADYGKLRSYENLEKLKRTLERGNYTICAEYVDEKTKASELITAAVMYTKHRFCPVWNYRKRQIIRGRYERWLSETDGWKDKRPVHVVLTMKHDAENGWDGKHFYARDLIAAFTKLRRLSFWKSAVWGGEYGLEITRNKNGLHIHLHVIAFLYKDVSVNCFRETAREQWGKLTKNEGYQQFWAETLYYTHRDHKGRPIMEVTGRFPAAKDVREDLGGRGFKEAKNAFYDDGIVKMGVYDESQKGGSFDDEDEFEIRRSKSYIDPDSSSLYQWRDALLEAVKYHYKGDEAIKDENGNYDFELAEMILANTKHLRHFSRFGALYDEPLLNFNLDKETDELEADDVETTPLTDKFADEGEDGLTTDASEPQPGNSDNFAENEINPFTRQPPTPMQRGWKLIKGAWLKQAKDFNEAERFTLQKWQGDVPIKQVIAEFIDKYVTGKLRKAPLPNRAFNTKS